MACAVLHLRDASHLGPSLLPSVSARGSEVRLFGGVGTFQLQQKWPLLLSLVPLVDKAHHLLLTGRLQGSASGLLVQFGRSLLAESMPEPTNKACLTETISEHVGVDSHTLLKFCNVLCKRFSQAGLQLNPPFAAGCRNRSVRRQVLPDRLAGMACAALHLRDATHLGPSRLPSVSAW